MVSGDFAWKAKLNKIIWLIITILLISILSVISFRVIYASINGEQSLDSSYLAEEEKKEIASTYARDISDFKPEKPESLSYLIFLVSIFLSSLSFISIYNKHIEKKLIVVI